ncbi:MAG: DUF4838 domain-containing protein [Phycisphaerae bacterium]|nr:DUF4838 domain-containing protein [Phycisphaerae bacterium]
MNIGKTLGLVFIISFVILASSVYGIEIANNGNAKAIIVVAKDAPIPDQHAAIELAGFLKQITGAQYQIHHLPVKESNCILVGLDAARANNKNIPINIAGDEGIMIYSTDNTLILAGAGKRGTLYAVYTFLEDFLGCRWWSSKASTIPTKHTIELSDINYSYSPALEYRSAYWYDAFDGDWSVRNKCNGINHRLDEKRGQNHVYQGFVHTFYQLIPPDKYYKDHPEWFSEINGKRVHQRAQLCLTNIEMRNELVKNLKEQLKKNPAATIASVSQNDWHGFCQCEKCKAVDQEQASPSGSLLQFVNAVAEEIEKDFSQVAISTLAYQYTRKPPKTIKPRHNVIVRLCSIECSFSQPLTHQENIKFSSDIEGWSKICNRLHIWDYTTNFRYYILLHPNLRVLGPNIKFFAKHNVKGIFEQGAYNSYGAEMAELRAWVLAKLLWNPDLDAQKLIDEFLLGYYGDAGTHIAAYLKLTHDSIEKSGERLGCFNTHSPKYMTYEMLTQAWQLLQNAQQAVKNNPKLLSRVQCAQLPLMNAFLLNWQDLQKQSQKSNIKWPLPESILKVKEQFLAIAKKNNITRMEEWKTGFGQLDQAVGSL